MSEQTPTTSGSLDHREQVHALFLRHQQAVRVFILGMVRDFAATDDLLQETFLTVSRKAADFQLNTNFVAWACSIARFKVLDYLRAERRRGQLTPAAVEALMADEQAVVDPRLDGLEDCIERLAPQARRVLTLRYTSAHLPQEIASVMGWTTGAVNVALTRARVAVRECLERRRTIAFTGGHA